MPDGTFHFGHLNTKARIGSGIGILCFIAGGLCIMIGATTYRHHSVLIAGLVLLPVGFFLAFISILYNRPQLLGIIVINEQRPLDSSPILPEEYLPSGVLPPHYPTLPPYPVMVESSNGISPPEYTPVVLQVPTDNGTVPNEGRNEIRVVQISPPNEPPPPYTPS